MPMINEVITHKHEWVRGLFSELDRIAKDAAMMADENQPLLGGEHYLTDRELSERLKISRRTLQDYRNNGILPYRQLGGKILYRESDIERVLQSCYRGKFYLLANYLHFLLQFSGQFSPHRALCHSRNISYNMQI